MTEYWKVLRPGQWLKNLMLFFPPFLGGVLFMPGVAPKGILPFVSFCLASSATYIYNDLQDREQDRTHPRKQHRPIASGTLPVPRAVTLACGLLVAAFVLCVGQPVVFVGWLLAYLGLSFAYSTVLKNQPVIDLFCIASGFVFRLFAGGVVFAVPVSDWLFLSVMLLALFLSAGKRLGEKMVLGESAGEHRKSLAICPDGVLEGFMLISGATVLVTYTMYAITMHRLVYTVPLCCFGLFRYVFMVKKGEGGDPTDSLMKDPVMFIVGLAWVSMVGVAIYYPS